MTIPIILSDSNGPRATEMTRGKIKIICFLNQFLERKIYFYRRDEIIKNVIYQLCVVEFDLFLIGSSITIVPLAINIMSLIYIRCICQQIRIQRLAVRTCSTVASVAVSRIAVNSFNFYGVCIFS